MKSLILGYGTTGKAVSKYLKDKNISFLIFDDNPELSNFYKIEDIKFSEIDKIFVSPGIRSSHRILEIAKEKNIDVLTDIEEFSSITKTKIIGVTGTNGKTTFVHLLSKILNEKGIISRFAGNIGNSPLEIVNELEQVEYIILELSSFQLEHIKKLNLYIGIILNIYEDHTEWHGSYEKYKNSKIKIFDYVNTPTKKILGESDSALSILINKESSFTSIKSLKEYSINNYFDDFIEVFLYVCSLFSISENESLNFLKKQDQIEHRLEFFYEVNGVKFINDSKSTNLQSVSKASTKFENSILILHGLTKGINSNKLNLSENIKKILVPKDMDVDLTKYKNIIIYYDSIFEIISYLKNNIEIYNHVLFSCGGASFNNFKDYKDRGTFFKNIVMKEFR